MRSISAEQRALEAARQLRLNTYAMAHAIKRRESFALRARLAAENVRCWSDLDRAMDEVDQPSGEPATAGMLEQVQEAAEVNLQEMKLITSELQELFDSQWQADQRAIRMWQSAHPNSDMTWPDHGRMVQWLLERDTILSEALDSINDSCGCMPICRCDEGVKLNRDTAARALDAAKRVK